MIRPGVSLAILCMALATGPASAQRHPLTAASATDEDQVECNDVSSEAMEVVAIQAAKMMSKEPALPSGTLSKEQRLSMDASTNQLTQQVAARKAQYDPDTAKQDLLKEKDRFSAPGSQDGKTVVMRGNCVKKDTRR